MHLIYTKVLWLNRMFGMTALKSLFVCLFLSTATLVCAEEIPEDLIAASDGKTKLTLKDTKTERDVNGYTINYNNVSIIEYIKFVTKICNVNFLFNESDLNFNVTVVSEDPITPQNVMSTLIQILRIHGLNILEQDKNLVIHNSADVKQFAKLVFDGQPLDKSYPIVTKVFRLNTKVDAIAAIIRPMLSTEAILDVSPETQMIILTDITTNVEKVSLLIDNLQSPQTSMTIEPYHVKFNDPAFLINMASQIMAPLSQGHPYIMVPQPKANAIFIVSTPALVEKTITVLTNLDTAPKKEKAPPKELKAQNIFIYKVMNKSLSEVIRGLHEISQNIQASGYSEKGLVESIDTVKPIKETNSLLFTGDPETLSKLREILGALDVSNKETEEAARESFFMYKPQHRSPNDISDALGDLLRHTKIGDKSLLETLMSAKVVPTTQSIVFTGDPATFTKVRDILATIDIPGKAPAVGKSTFFVYQIKNVTDEQLETSLKSFARDIEKSGVAEEGLIQSINNMKYLKDTNSIVFTGDDKSLKRLQDLLPSFDHEMFSQAAQQKKMSERAQFYVYKPKFLKGDEIAKSLKDVAENLKDAGLADPALLRSIDSMKWVKSTNSLLFTGDPASLQKIEGLIQTIDVQAQIKPGHERTFYLYQLQYAPREKVEQFLSQVADNLKKKGLKEEDLIEAIYSMKWIPDSHSFMFSGTQTSLARIKELLTAFDIPAERAVAAAQPLFILYQLQYVSRDKMEDYLRQIAQHLNRTDEKQNNLYKAIYSMKWIDSSQSFMFSGTKDALNQIQDMIKEFDTVAQKGAPQATFLLYTLKYVTQAQMDGYLQQVMQGLSKAKVPEPDLISSIDSRKWIPESRSFMFSGSPATLNRISDMVKGFDVAEQVEKPQEQSYFVYKLEHASGDAVEDSLRQFESKMKSSGYADKNVTAVIDKIQWVKDTNSLLLTGDPKAINDVKALIAQYDVAKAAQTYFVYKLQHASGDTVEAALQQFEAKMKTSGYPDKGIINVIDTIQWVKDTNSLLLTGDPKAVDAVKALVAQYDVSKPTVEQTYFVYKLQHVSGDIVEDDLHQFETKMKSSGYADKNILNVIDKIQWIKETNSLLLTGDPKAIDEVKALIEQYDVVAKTPSKRSDFFMYKPQHISPSTLERSLKDLGDNLKKADLADDALLSAIASARYNDSTQSIIFTGNPPSLQKIEGLVKEIDIPSAKPAPIQHIGKTTFMLYKLKVATGPQIMKSLNGIASDLKKSGTSDKNFLAALNSMKYIRETNSLLFTGTEPALEKIKPLVDKFDVPELGIKVTPEVAPSNFFIYKPQYLSGPQLESTLTDFADHLKETGLSDPALFNTIHTMKWVEKTGSLVFTGDDKTLARVKELLKEFDVGEKAVPGPVDSSIQAIDNTSFLVYKLQFHKGDEIQGALRSIGSDLLKSNSAVNASLLNAIHSIQWLQVTNSLLSSGDQETLTRLKELIKNLDVPLKQVFIEVLVIETTISNILNFGLNWGGKVKFKDDFAGSTGNFNSTPAASTGTPNLSNSITNVNATSFPLPQNIPFEQNFDLGVIGDIVFHKGRSFVSLGSLMQALQTDSETSIVMTPKIISQDNKTSSIFIGQNIPFVGSFVQNTQVNTLSTTNLEYRDIGMNLTITPVLGNADVVTLDIVLDNTAVPANAQGQNTNVSVGGVQGITTSKTTLNTTVHVPNENFLVLSGMINTSKNRQKQGIPCLGGLPLIGAAFSALNTIDSKDNIVIFMRPHIINSYSDMKRITQDQEDLFQENAGSQSLEADYVDGLELLKSIDDE